MKRIILATILAFVTFGATAAQCVEPPKKECNLSCRYAKAKAQIRELNNKLIDVRDDSDLSISRMRVKLLETKLSNKALQASLKDYKARLHTALQKLNIAEKSLKEAQAENAEQLKTIKFMREQLDDKDKIIDQLSLDNTLLDMRYESVVGDLEAVLNETRKFTE